MPEPTVRRESGVEYCADFWSVQWPGPGFKVLVFDDDGAEHLARQIARQCGNEASARRMKQRVRWDVLLDRWQNIVRALEELGDADGVVALEQCIKEVRDLLNSQDQKEMT